MKYWLIIGISLICFGSISAMAQDSSVTSAPSTSLNLIQLGHFNNPRWQFGIDKSATVAGCIQRELKDGQWLAGPCRDIFVLAKDGISRAHLGGAIMYNAEHGNASYEIRAGIALGPATRAAVDKLAETAPGLEVLTQIKLPKWAAYLTDITTLDFAAGYRPIHTADVVGNWTYGPMAQMNFPLEDLYSLLKIGL